MTYDKKVHHDKNTSSGMMPGKLAMEEKFEYFMQRTEKDLEHIRLKVDQLWGFRLMVIGGSLAISTICTIAVNLLLIYVKA